jgi:hypothetical protein
MNGQNAHYTKALQLYNKWAASCLPLCLVGCTGDAASGTMCTVATGATTGKCNWVGDAATL